MRFLGTLTTTLILGILHSTIAGLLFPMGQTQSDFSTDGTMEPTIESIEATLRSRCEKNGGPGAYENLKKDLLDFPNCIQSALDMEQLQADTVTALQRGEWNTFFKKYCRKVPALELCLTQKTGSMIPCLEPDEQTGFEVSNNVTRSSLEFICQDDGWRLAMFVNTGGMECISSEKEALMACITAAAEKNPRMIDQRQFGWSHSGPEDCATVKEIRNCTIAVMQTCNDQTPAQLIQTIFDFYDRERACEVVPEATTTSTTESWIPTIPQEPIPVEDETLNRIRIKCEQNGGQKAYETFKESAQLVLRSYELVANSSDISDELRYAAPGEEMVNVVKKYCRRAPILKGLIKYASDSMKHCLEPDERESVDVIYKIRSAMLEFVGYNEGERVSTFVDSGAMECLGYRGQGLFNCASQHFADYSPSIFSVGAPALWLENLEVPFVRGDKFCFDLHKFRECSLEALAECGDRTTNLNLLQSAIESIHKEIPCGNLFGKPENSTPAPDLEIITDESHPHTMRTVSNGVFQQYLSERCEPNYQPSEYEAARAMPYYLSKYVQFLVDKLGRIHFKGIMSVAGVEQLKVIFKDFCAHVSSVEERMKRMQNFSETCPYLRDQEKTMDIIQNTTTAIQEYVCDFKGIRFARFVASGGIECWASVNRTIESCVAQYFPTNVEFDKRHDPSISSASVCHFHVAKAQQCFVNALEHCEGQLPARIIEFMIDFIVDVVRCENVPNP